MLHLHCSACLGVIIIERLWSSQSDDHKRYLYWYCLPDKVYNSFGQMQ